VSVAEKDEVASIKNAYAIVGELVLIANALDYELNRVLITVMHLDESPMLVPVVAALDPGRKIEMLKARAKHLSSKAWGDKLRDFISHVESVFQQRNFACHLPPSLSSDGNWSLVPVAAVKMLKGFDPITGSVKSVSFNDFKTAIHTARIALGEVHDLLQNFEQLNEKLNYARMKQE
jgi:hypothetical protein